jgi:hypothetical protein
MRSKIMLGALVALIGVGLAGTPAQAAGKYITVKAAKGDVLRALPKLEMIGRWGAVTLTGQPNHAGQQTFSVPRVNGQQIVTSEHGQVQRLKSSPQKGVKRVTFAVNNR